MPAQTLPHILIIDDDAMNREILEAFLEGDYRITLANNGARGLALAEDDPPALIILDINMPDMDGFAVCESLKHQPHTQDIPVVFVTSYDSPQDMSRGQAVGAAAFLSRPFDGDDLLNLVAELIQQHLD